LVETSRHFLWNYLLQESQQTPGVFQVTSFLQFPHGYLTSFNLDSLGSPTATSSPMQKTRSNTYTKKPRSDTPLRILVVNCQSIKNKKQELENLVETSKPDIMIGRCTFYLEFYP
jgi:hypothetical protein